MAKGLEDEYEDDEELDEEAAVPASRGGSSKKKLLILVVLPILLVVGAMAGAYFSGLADPLLQRLEGDKPPDEEASKESPGPVFYDLPEILANLDTTEGASPHFLKIQVSLELKTALDAPEIESVMPIIIDKFQVFLRELRVQDLQGSADVLRIQEELRDRVNDTIKPAEVSNVLIKDMLVQ